MFRQATRCGPLITSQKPLRYPTFKHDIARLSESAGFEDTLGGYCRRRATSNAVDGESLGNQFAHCGRPADRRVGSATKAVSDKVMRHNPKSDIFQAYVNEHVNVDGQAAFLERPSKKALIRAFAHMNPACEPRAPTSVNAASLDALPSDRDLQKLIAVCS